MAMRKNEGFEIIKKEVYYTSERDNCYEIVLGYNGTTYVTWECRNLKDYFWGHYFTNELHALIDFHQRLMKNYKNHIPPFNDEIRKG